MTNTRSRVLGATAVGLMLLAANCSAQIAPSDDTSEIRNLRIGDHFAVSLASFQGTGAKWVLVNADGVLIEKVTDREAAAGPGYKKEQVFEFKAARSGSHDLLWELRRPWSKEPLQQRHVSVSIQ
jgi:predicted secreted protein